MYVSLLKPLIDRLAALILLLMLMPVMIAVTLILAFDLRTSPFFFQTRGGYKNRIFKVMKFKTMTDERDANGELKSDAERLTKMGKTVRALSLDELPQLFNVLLGQMSLIGPRPLMSEYLSIYTSEELRRHNVKPGITGWAQVNGRNSLNWKQKFKLDLYYVDNQSLMLDIKIALLTVIKVIKRDSVSQQGAATMEKYNGSN